MLHLEALCTDFVFHHRYPRRLPWLSCGPVAALWMEICSYQVFSRSHYWHLWKISHIFHSTLLTQNIIVSLAPVVECFHVLFKVLGSLGPERFFTKASQHFIQPVMLFGPFWQRCTIPERDQNEAPWPARLAKSTAFWNDMLRISWDSSSTTRANRSLFHFVLPGDVWNYNTAS